MQKISRRRPPSADDSELGNFTLLFCRTAKKCTKIYNARAQLLFCSLNLLFSDVLVAVVVVVCLSFLLPRDDPFATSIHYKETDSHSCLNFKSSQPFKCKASIPTSPNFYDCGKFAAWMAISKKQQPPWSLSSLGVAIPSNWYRGEDARQPRHQELFF